MALSLQEAVALRIEDALKDFLSTVRRVPPDRLEWQAIGDARSVLDIVQECGRVNDRWAQMLATGQWITWPREHIEELVSKTADIERAVRYLQDATAAYVQAVRDMPDSRLGSPFETPWRTATTAEWLMHGLWHLSYHEGQLNYIQTLYGDWSFGD